METAANKRTVKLIGIVGSKGYCSARAYIFRRRIEVKETHIESSAIDREKERLEVAIQMTSRDIEAVRKEACKKHGEKYAAIFDSHLLMLSDPQFKPRILRKLSEKLVNIESIVKETVDDIHASFMAIEDTYLRERAIDIKDVGERLLRHLMGLEGPAEEIGDEPYILIAQDVTPSEILDFAKGPMKGVCLDTGGATSHVAILAGALGIPSVFGLVDLSRVAHTGDRIVLDTRTEGTVILNPHDSTVQSLESSVPDDSVADLLSDTTSDGFKVRIGANIARIEELNLLKGIGVKRIGLFRSEFLFMESMDLPGEGYQEKIYRKVVAAAPEMAVLRTIDIGSDKPVRYLPFPPEENPAMGFRSVRFALARKDVFIPQLRAMIKAGQHGNCRIIFPMVSTPEELRELDDIYRRTLDEISPSHAPEWGIMVEVPSAIFMMEYIAGYTRYISLGTNDLLQFFYAIDRTNERLARLASPLCIPFLRLLYYCLAAANGEGIKVGICGEMASDLKGFVTLLGIGLEEFSLRPDSVNQVKRLIPKLSKHETVHIIQEILASGKIVDLNNELSRIFPMLNENE